MIELKHGEVKTLNHMIAWFKGGDYCDGKSCDAARKARHQKLKADRKKSRKSIRRIGWGGEVYSDLEYDSDDDEAESDADSYDDWGVPCHHPLVFDIEMFALAGTSRGHFLAMHSLTMFDRLLRHRGTSSTDRNNSATKDRAPSSNLRVGSATQA